jgi:hypothetical protein
MKKIVYVFAALATIALAGSTASAQGFGVRIDGGDRDRGEVRGDRDHDRGGMRVEMRGDRDHERDGGWRHSRAERHVMVIKQRRHHRDD